MKKSAAIVVFICFSLYGCAYRCACDEELPEQRIPSALPVTAKSESLQNECAFLDEAVRDSRVFAEKMAKSRYAIYYQAMSRERTITLLKRASEIGCP